MVCIKTVKLFKRVDTVVSYQTPPSIFNTIYSLYSGPLARRAFSFSSIKGLSSYDPARLMRPTRIFLLKRYHVGEM